MVGHKLARGLIARGFEIRVLDLPGTTIDGLDVDLRHGDITDPASLTGLFDGVETVYHLAAVLLASDPARYEKMNVDGTRNVLAAAAAAGVKHFVHISSASVVYSEPTAYSLSKRAGEAMVRAQTDMAYTIIRPTLVYDEHGGEEFMKYLEFLKRFPIVSLIGQGSALKSPVHTDDVVEGLIAIAGNPKTFGKIYAFSGGENISMVNLSRLMLEHQGLRKPFMPIPVWACRMLAGGLKRIVRRPALTWQMIAGVIQDANLDHTNATEDLGYRPKTVHDGFQICWPLAAR